MRVCVLRAWLHRSRNEGRNALNELKNWNKAKLRETLDWIQKNVPARERRAHLTAVETILVEGLKEHRARLPKQQYLKFHYSSKEASTLHLRSVLRNPDAYTKHPEPDAAAAIMVCDAFHPQIQAILCNYAATARESNTSEAAGDSLKIANAGVHYR